MKKLITTLFCSFLGGGLFAQWAPTTFAGGTDKTSHKEVIISWILIRSDNSLKMLRKQEKMQSQ
jgi:hypothetical protein